MGHSIYQLEKSINQASAGPHDAEASPLLNGNDDPDTVFRHALDAELEKISSFYRLKEFEIYGEIDAVVSDVRSYEADTEGHDNDLHEGPTGSRKIGRGRQGSISRNLGIGRQRRVSNVSASINEADEDGSSDEDADEGVALTNGKVKDRSRPWDGEQSVDDLRSSREIPKRRSSQMYDDYSDHAFSTLYASGMTLKKRIISLYVSLCELKSFIQLNKTGFSKALKKYDKTINRNLKSQYMKNTVNTATPFQEQTMKNLDENIATAEKLYADIGTKGDIQMAKRELRLHLREHVVWERNTVWREMIGIERKAQAANMGVRRTLLGADHDPRKAMLQGDEPDEMGTKELVTPVGRFTCPRWLFSSTFFTLITIIIVFVVMLVVPIMKERAQQNCLAMLVFVSLLWATEVFSFHPVFIPLLTFLQVIPLFVTALLVPFLVVILRVMRSDEKPHRRLDAKDAAGHVFAAMWTPVIVLLLGGFTIAAALSRYNIAKLMATFVLSKAGTRPRTVLVTNMFVAMVASMWISNVAAPVLCFSIIQVSSHPPYICQPKSLTLQ